MMGPLIVVFGSYLTKKTHIKVGPPLTKLSGFAHEPGHPPCLIRVFFYEITIRSYLPISRVHVKDSVMTGWMLFYWFRYVPTVKRATCIKGLIWPHQEPETESYFSD